MRTVPDDYVPASGGSASPSAQSQPLSADEASQQAVLAHSSRIYDALRVRHDAACRGELRTVENGGATYVHHAWATEPLAEDRAARVMARADDGGLDVGVTGPATPVVRTRPSA
ncbi:hypothetical protein AB0892_24605 [Streptomyces sp. NPDC005409]|uniref:hypothetical protein n=1 Tax=Streptomyces sp. NPDC005409 TaxID=3155342 RepID=UPI0034571D8E